MKQFLDDDWLRAIQFFPKCTESLKLYSTISRKLREIVLYISIVVMVMYFVLSAKRQKYYSENTCVLYFAHVVAYDLRTTFSQSVCTLAGDMS